MFRLSGVCRSMASHSSSRSLLIKPLFPINRPVINPNQDRDSYQFAVAPSTKARNVDIQHFGWGLGDKPLISKFGLAMYIKSRHAETRNIREDFGYTPKPLSVTLVFSTLTPLG